MEDQDPAASRIASIIKEVTQHRADATPPAGPEGPPAPIIVVVNHGTLVAGGTMSAGGVFSAGLPPRVSRDVATVDPGVRLQELGRLVDDWMAEHNAAGREPALTPPSAWAQLGDAIGVQSSIALAVTRYSLARSWLRHQRDALKTA